MRRLLITGAAGFIGSNFVHYWIQRHPDDRILALDSLTYAGNLRNLAAATECRNFKFVRGDIRDHNLVVETLIDEKIDTIVHFDAESHVDRSIAGPDEFIQTNIVGTHSLLRAAHSVWVDRRTHPTSHRFHHISTDEVYGSLLPQDPPFTELNRFCPNSPYAASKASSDHLVRAFFKTYGLQISVTNCSNNYGAFQFPEKLVPLVITNVLRGEVIPVYGDGLNIRDWLHVDDHCRAIELVIRNGIIGETYNVGGQNELKNIDIVKSVCVLLDEMFSSFPDLKNRFPDSPAQTCDSASLIRYVEDRPGHDRRYAVDSSKIIAQLGFSLKRTFESGLRETVTWYVENEDWWRQVLDGSYKS